eukprot:10247653-Alexandrium_andersonii.AAC.1
MGLREMGVYFARAGLRTRTTKDKRAPTPCLQHLRARPRCAKHRECASRNVRCTTFEHDKCGSTHDHAHPTLSQEPSGPSCQINPSPTCARAPRRAQAGGCAKARSPRPQAARERKTWLTPRRQLPRSPPRAAP